MLNHEATWYLDHANAVATLWRDLVGGPQPKSFTSIARGLLRVVATPTRRALLVGINEYPDPRNKLGYFVDMADVLTQTHMTLVRIKDGEFDELVKASFAKTTAAEFEAAQPLAPPDLLRSPPSAGH